MARWSWVVAVGLGVSLAGRARAGDDTEAAAEAFREGTRAASDQAYSRAARAFARADALSPNPVALDAALRAALLADDAPLGMELVERSARSDDTAALATVGEARAKFASRVGKLRVTCEACTASLDGTAIATNQPVWTGIGNHEVGLSEGGRAVARNITIVAGEEVVATMPPRPKGPTGATLEPDRAREPEGFRGISPAFFFIGLGLTLGSGAGLIASAIDTKNKHEAFESASDETLQREGQKLKEDGEAATLRTNVLVGVTAGLGATTVVLGVLTNWKSLSSPAPPRPAEVTRPRFALALDDDLAFFSLSGSFW